VVLTEAVEADQEVEVLADAEHVVELAC